MSGTDFEKLNIVLAARDREFAQAMDRNTRRIERFARQSNKKFSGVTARFNKMGAAAKSNLRGIATAVAALASVNSLKTTTARLDEIGKTADRLGLSTDALQEFRAAAEGAGVAQATFDMAMQRFGRRLAEARIGKGEAKDALAELKIEMFDAHGAALPLEQVFGQVADKMADMSSQTDRNRLAMKLFDSEGVALVNLLREGSAGMDEMRREARELGVVINESLIRKAEESQTKLDLMSRVISANLSTALINIAPLLVNAAEGIAAISGAVNEFLSISSAFEEVDNGLSSLEQSAIDMGGLTDELERFRAARQAVDDLPSTNGQYTDDADTLAVVQAMVDANDALTDAISRRKAEMRAIDGINSAAAEIEEAKEAARLREMGAEAAERERISREKTAMIDRIMANASAASGGVLTGETREMVTQLASEWEAAQIAASKILNPVKAAGGATAEAADEALNYEKVLARIAQLTGATGLETAGFAEVLAEVDALLKEGAINGEQYAEMVGEIETQFDAAARASEQIKDGARGAFQAIVTGSESARDAVSKLLMKMAEMAAGSAFDRLFGGSSIWDTLGGLFGGGGGAKAAKVPSFSGGGNTGSAPRSGGLDGQGGFLAMLHPQESVIDHAKGGSGAPAGGGGVMSINVHVSGARGNAEITEMVNNGVRQGLSEYDRSVLPRRVTQISKDPRKVK